ncbi:MAG: acyltransferase family protein [Gammaproteobacteria bacterium]|nr:acyltransferase family protein [Gammaproteobacteria bacterium]
MTRNHLLDNAKYILILFVVFGHMIEPLINTQEIIKTVYLSIYSFHMPAFVIIAGMLSKADLSNERITKLITSIVIPFIVFTVLYELFNFVTEGHISNYTRDLQPYWILWFLYSLFIWKLSLPIILNFRFPIVTAFIIAVGVGYSDSIGDFSGLSRTLYFFPFFIIGYKFSPKCLFDMKMKFNSNLYVVALFGILALNFTLFSLFHDMQHQWLYGSHSYAQLGQDGWMAAVIRVSLYAISLLTVMSILLLIPNREIKFLSKGKNSLQVYVWHGFFIKVFSGIGIIYVVGTFPTMMTLVVLFGVSVILTLMLSSDFVAKRTQDFILDPIHKILLSKS